MKHPNKEVMERAVRLAKEKYKEGGHAVAAVIVRLDEVIAEAFTTINRDQNPVGHAEMNAIQIAANYLKSKTLEDCYLYTTFEPCPMCTSAAIWAKMKGIVYGASMEDETEQCHQRIKIRCSEVIKSGTPKLELYPDFMRDEGKKLLVLD